MSHSDSAAARPAAPAPAAARETPASAPPASPLPTPESEVLERDSGAERIIAFTDAAVAIALTLLVLPLMESVAAVGEAHENPHAGPWLAENSGAIIGFLMSFALVAAYWSMHHGAMREVRSFRGHMLSADLVWLLSIVVLPVTTGIVIGFQEDLLQKVLYLGNLALIGLSLVWLELEILLHPGASAYPERQRGHLSASLGMVASVLISFLLVAFTPLQWSGMAAMGLVIPLQRLLNRFVLHGQPEVD